MDLHSTEYRMSSSSTSKTSNGRSPGNNLMSESSYSNTPKIKRGYSSSLEQQSTQGKQSLLIDDLRADGDEKAYLEKSNFDLKMKVYYLEENLKKLVEAGAGSSTHDMDEGMRSENTSLRLQLEEKCIQIEERNALLIKAKHAIETLKNEATRLRNEQLAHGGMDQRMRETIRDYEEAEAKYKFKIEQLEVQVSTLQQAMSMKDHGVHMTDEKLRLSRQELEDARRAQVALDEECRMLQKRIAESHTNLVESRSEVDSLRIQLAEQSDAISDYKEMIAELQAMVSRLTTDRDQLQSSSELRMDNMKNQYEDMIDAVKRAAEADVDKLNDSHAKLVKELKESHSKELDRANAAKEEALRSSRNQETTELFRMREDLQHRLQEKQEELRSLKTSMEMERVRMESVLREAEDIKAESRQRLATIDALKTENASIEVLKVELRQSQQQCNDLKNMIQQDVAVERNQLLSRVEVLSDNLEASRDTVRELEHTNSTLNDELSRIKEEIYTSKKNTSDHYELTRENERLRASSTALRDEVKDLSGAVQTLQQECKSNREALARVTADLDRSRLVLRLTSSLLQMLLTMMVNQALDASEEHASALEDALQEEKKKFTSSDAALSEHRSLTSKLSSELDDVKQSRNELDRRCREGLDKLDALREDIGKTCVMLSDALDVWDQQLEVLSDIPNMAMEKLSLSIDIRGDKRSQAIRDFISRSDLVSSVSITMQQHQEELTRANIIRIERFRMKIDRLLKLKQMFDAKSEALLKGVEGKIAIASDRMIVQSHRLTDVEGHFSKIKRTIERDNETRLADRDELRHFRESVLTEHTQQMQVITQALEKERSQNDSLRNELQQASYDLREYQSHAGKLNEMEDMVNKLQSRFDEVVESNRLLLMELEDRAKKYDKLKKEYSNVTSSKENFQSENQSLFLKLQTKDDELDHLRRQISYLRSREIDPELERSFRETQSIMKTYKSPDRMQDTSGDSFQHLSELVERVHVVYKSVNSLVSSTSAAIDSFSDLSEGSTRSQLRDLSENIFELLDLNSRLSMQVKRVASDLKAEIDSASSVLRHKTVHSPTQQKNTSNRTSSNGGGRKGNGSSSDNGSGNPAPEKRSPSKTDANGISRPTHNSSRSQLTIPSVPRESYDSEPDYIPQIHPETRTGNSQNARKQNLSRSSSVDAIKHTYNIPSRRGLKETYDSEPDEISQIHPELFRDNQMGRNFQSESTDAPLDMVKMHRGWSESSGPPDRIDTGEKRAQVHPMNESDVSKQRQMRRSSPLTMSHLGDNDAHGRSIRQTAVYSTSALTPTRTVHGLEMTIPRSTPNGSVTKASTDRLQRLGEDLQALARKLDSFDSGVKY